MRHFTTLALGAVLLVVGAATALADDAAQQTGREVLAEYQKIQAALAADSTAGVVEAAATLADAAKPCNCTLEESAASKALVDAARAMTGTGLAALRERFKPLSEAMPAYLTAVGVDTAQLYYCPMAKAYWMQAKSEAAIHNPYLGTKMSMCGVKASGIEAGKG